MNHPYFTDEWNPAASTLAWPQWKSFIACQQWSTPHLQTLPFSTRLRLPKGRLKNHKWVANSWANHLSIIPHRLCKVCGSGYVLQANYMIISNLKLWVYHNHAYVQQLPLTSLGNRMQCILTIAIKASVFFFNMAWFSPLTIKGGPVTSGMWQKLALADTPKAVNN